MAARLIIMLIVSIIAGQYLPYCTVSASHSLLLNDATFTDKVKEKDTLWLVKFCVPWCKYCSSAQVVWEELGKTLDIEDSVEIGHVDCTSSKDTCSKIGIRSYPTVKLFYDGDEYKKYTGKREVLEIKDFVLNAVYELNKKNSESLLETAPEFSEAGEDED
ncbi:hypothetical protein KP509_1Z065400 [Ceratopteris richardii]|nr:hypothetical protein KP509_1Z065400 [Ceratopteris richardii]